MKNQILAIILAVAGLQIGAVANPNDTVLVYKGRASHIAVGDNATDKTPLGAYLVVEPGAQEARIVNFYKLGTQKFYHDSGSLITLVKTVPGAKNIDYSVFEHQSELMNVLAINNLSVYFFGKQAPVNIDNSGTKFVIAPVLTGVLRNLRQDSILVTPVYFQQNFTAALNPALTVEVNKNNDSVTQASQRIISDLKAKGFVAD